MLKYYNDGKERFQSHEIYDDEFKGEITTGYGRTVWEALDEYIVNVNSYLQKIEKLYKQLHNNPELHIVDGAGCLKE
jgi:hypothetical protein